MPIKIISMCVLWLYVNVESCEGLQFLKLSVVEDTLNIIGFSGSMPKTSSYGRRFMFFLICETNTNGKVITFCDQVSYCEFKIVRKKVVNCLLVFSTKPFNHGA